MNRTGIFLICLLVTGFWVYPANCQSTLIRDIETTYQFDEVGNIAYVARKSGDGYADTQTVHYQYNRSEWLMAAPLELQNTSSTPDGNLITRTTQFVPDQNTGRILFQTIEPNQLNESTFNLIQYHFDAHGASDWVVSSDSSGRQRRAISFQSDALEDLYPISRTNAFGQTESLGVHPAFGVLVARVDVNGVADEWQYDQFGRLKQVLAADGANLSLSYTGPGFDINMQYANNQTGDVLYDPYLYEIQRDKTGFDGQSIIRLTTYNGQNLVAERQGPCFYGSANCSSSGLKRYTYDELGRLIRLQGEDGYGPNWTHSGLKTTRHDAVGNERYTIQDQLGHVTKTAAITTGGREIPTTFAYEPFGLLRTITDAYGNRTVWVHDVRGRASTLNDPDSGDHVYQWTCFNELSDDQDGNGLHTTYVRDPLGRVRTITNTKDGTAKFEWDTAPNGIGKIASETSTDGITTAYVYNSMAS